MKICRVCQKEFEPHRPMQSVCSVKCSIKKVRQDKAAEREQTKKRKQALKTIPDLIKEAQTAFNAYIRARDAGKPCICCGMPLDDSGGMRGQGFDAGHWRSTGSASHLRFNEDNCHGQRKVCNKYGAGRAVDYRRGLIERIGIERVEALENDNTPHKWTREELIAIRDKYRAKLKTMQ